MDRIFTTWLVLLLAVICVCTACDKRAVDTCNAALSEEYDPLLRQVVDDEISQKEFYQKKCRMVERYYACITPLLVGCDEEYIKGWTDWGKQKKCGIDGLGTTPMTGLGTTEMADYHTMISMATQGTGSMVMAGIVAVVIVSLND